jgi:hypothetical protein
MMPSSLVAIELDLCKVKLKMALQKVFASLRRMSCLELLPQQVKTAQHHNACA